MGKRRANCDDDNGSSTSDSGLGSDILSLSKKRQRTVASADKKAQAMNALKAKRDERKEREEKGNTDLGGVSSEANKKKL